MATGERTYSIDSSNPVEFFGLKNANIDLIIKEFPQLRIVVRGNEIRAMGAERFLDEFEDIINFMFIHYERFGLIRQSDIKQLLNSTHQQKHELYSRETNGNVLVHGRNGKLIKARSTNQHKIVESVEKNDVVFAIGPAGTGKTYTAVALAVRALKNREVKRIVLTRPAVEAGENLGFLPGDLREKLDPYLQPLYDALRDMLPQQRLLSYLEDNVIEIAPLAFMRGRTLDNAFVILDEAQNTTASQLKMFLTRMGMNAKFVITGDITQIDLPKNQKSGLAEARSILKDIKGIDFVILDKNDVVRHKLVTKIIAAYENHKNLTK